MRKAFFLFTCGLVVVGVASAQTLSPQVRGFVKVDAPVVALAHVRVIDGTGAAARDDQTIVIARGKIESISDASSANVAQDALVLDLHGHSVMPGLVGMHDHMFYPMGNGIFGEMAFSFPRLYLAAGVTTIRTTGSLEPYADQEIKSYIDSGRAPGPEIYLTAPYLNGSGGFSLQMHSLSGPEDAIRNVNYWADEGFTSYKAYMQITRSELGAAIKAAHARGLKVTGHLCSVTFREAAELGIDDLEHGLEVDTDFVHGKDADTCPRSAQQSLLDLDVQGEPLRSLIDFLVQHKVAVTSTLPVFEANAPNRPPLETRFLDVLSLPSRTDYLGARAHADESGANGAVIFKKEEASERAFAK